MRALRGLLRASRSASVACAPRGATARASSLARHFRVSNTPVIWKKENTLSRRGVRAWEYDRDFEFIVVAVKGNPALTTARRLSGIKSYAIVPPMKMIHPNEKPLALIEDIVTDCSYEGNIIIDPFAGSGILGVACKNQKRNYILIERDREFYVAICRRMGKE